MHARGVREIKDMLCCKRKCCTCDGSSSIDDAVCLSEADCENGAKTRGALHSLCSEDNKSTEGL